MCPGQQHVVDEEDGGDGDDLDDDDDGGVLREKKETIGENERVRVAAAWRVHGRIPCS